MNGEIWVESPSNISQNEKNPGAIFHFTIEVYSNERLAKQIDSLAITNFNQINALILTTNKVPIKRLIRFLEYQQIHIQFLEFSENIIQDFTNLIKTENTFHVLFIIDEPDIDGLWLAAKMNEHKISNNYRIFLLSSCHKPDNYLKSRLLGVDYYIVQPFDHKTLINSLLDCFAGAKAFASKLQEIKRQLFILVADDNVINQKVAQNIFRSIGYEIDIASNGSETIEKVKNTNYDIIFMDLEMPDKDGIESTRDIRQLGYQMPIIAMTASSSELSKTSSMQVGMNEYITKPVKIETVQAILEKWFA
jgi:CheY-like chemotaxis protein